MATCAEFKKIVKSAELFIEPQVEPTMGRIRRWKIMDFLKDSKGAVAAEHALLLTLIAVAIMGAVTTFGQTVYTKLWALIGAMSF